MMTTIISILAVSVFAAALAWSAHRQNSEATPAGIEKLHKDDITATIARDVDALTALWDDNAVLLQPGSPPIVGKATFHDFIKEAFAKSPAVKVVKYVPDIHNVQVAANVAYEWDTLTRRRKVPSSKRPKAGVPNCFVS